MVGSRWVVIQGDEGGACQSVSRTEKAHFAEREEVNRAASSLQSFSSAPRIYTGLPLPATSTLA
jgi:hypothetical protein